MKLEYRLGYIGIALCSRWAKLAVFSTPPIIPLAPVQERTRLWGLPEPGWFYWDGSGALWLFLPWSICIVLGLLHMTSPLYAFGLVSPRHQWGFASVPKNIILLCGGCTGALVSHLFSMNLFPKPFQALPVPLKIPTKYEHDPDFDLRRGEVRALSSGCHYGC